MDKNMEIPLGIVDDDHLFVQLLCDFLQNHQDFTVTYTTHSGNSFLQDVEDGQDLPRVILLDLKMSNGNGLEVLRRLKGEKIPFRLVVLSSYYATDYVGQMLKLGADAFVSKATTASELVTVLKEVDQKGHYWSPEQIQAMRRQLSPKTPAYALPSTEGLTAREIEVLRLVCNQLTTREIAEELFLSPKTVETHKSNLLMKTAVRNIVGLVIYAIQRQIINPKEILLLDR